MSFQTNASALMNLLQSSQQYASGGDSGWLKLDPGTHRIRICPPWSIEGVPTRLIVNHQGYKNKDGYQRNPLCFSYAFNTENIATALVAKTVVKPEDLKFFGQYGCIYCRISDILINTQGKKNNKTFATPKFIFNVVNRADNKVYKWTASKKMFEGIAMYAGAYPYMFNVEDGMDLMLIATGSGLQRRYALNIIPDKCPLGVDLNVTPLHDLDATMADGYRNLNETMELILNSYPSMLNLLGINPNTIMTPTTAQI